MRMRPSRALAALLTAATACAIANFAVAQNPQAAGEASTMPAVGSMAPDFTLKYFDGKDLKDVSLAQYRGKKNVVVAFFIFAFTGG